MSSFQASNGRIMIVDDDSDVLEVIRKALWKWDLTSDSFTDPQMALEQFRNHPDLYSLVITDLKMPGMSGFEFIEQVTKIQPELKVIVMTAYFKDMLDIPKVLEGVVTLDAILEKPTGIKRVCEDVRRQLELH